MLIVVRAVKNHVHSLGRTINGEALPALNEVVRMILEDAAGMTKGRHRLSPFEIYYAAGKSTLAIKPRGR